MYAPTRAAFGGDGVEAGEHGMGGAFGDMNGKAGGGNKLENGGVQFANGGQRFAGEIGDECKVGDGGNGDVVVFQRRIGRDPGEVIVSRVLGHDGHGDDDREIIRGFPGQDIALVELPKVGVAGALNGALDVDRPAVVGGDGEVPVAELGVEIAEVAGGGAGCFFGVETVVGMGVLHETVFAAAELNELPHAGCLLAGNRAREEAGLGLGEVDHLLWHAFLVENATDHGSVTAGALEAGNEGASAAGSGEVIDVAQDGIGELEWELGYGGLELLADLAFQAGLEREGHFENGLERGLVEGRLLVGGALIGGVDFDAVSGFDEFLVFRDELGAAGGVDGRGKESLQGFVEFYAGGVGLSGQVCAALEVILGAGDADVGLDGGARQGGLGEHDGLMTVEEAVVDFRRFGEGRLLLGCWRRGNEGVNEASASGRQGAGGQNAKRQRTKPDENVPAYCASPHPYRTSGEVSTTFRSSDFSLCGGAGSTEGGCVGLERSGVKEDESGFLKVAFRVLAWMRRRILLPMYFSISGYSK